MKRIGLFRKYLLMPMLLLSPIVSLSSCSNDDINKEEPEIDYEEVKDFDLGNGIIYNGQFYNNKIAGKGEISYSNGDKLTGEFVAGILKNDAEVTYIFNEKEETFVGFGLLNEEYEFQMIEGKLELPNNRFYEGKFKNNLYNDENAIFDFGANTYYQGPFENGSNVGLIGTIYYPSHKMEGEGIWYFKGKMASLGKFESNQLGEGFIKFNDWSTYEGNIYYDGANWLRKGHGTQNFIECGFNASTVGGPSNLYLAKYVGEFDYSKSEWIYGNGVMYYVDDNLNPAGYTKGFYAALKRIKDPSIDLELDKDYINTTEYTYDPENLKRDQIASKYENKTPEIVFCGDSYMEMWQQSFNLANYEKDTEGLNCINTGIGGTIAGEWEYLSDKLIYDFNPDKVVIHLGFNDTHIGVAKEDVIQSLTNIRNKLVSQNKDIEIYFCGVEPSPNFSKYFEKESLLNIELEKMCENDANSYFIGTQNLFIENGQPIKDLRNYFTYDMVHLNSNGYKIWWEKIKNTIL